MLSFLTFVSSPLNISEKTEKRSSDSFNVTKAMMRLAHSFKQAQIEDILLLSPLLSTHSQRITLFFSPQLKIKFQDREKTIPNFYFDGNLELSQALIQGMSNERLAHRIIRQEDIGGYPASFLYLLLKDLSIQPKLTSLAPSTLRGKNHLQLGQVIYQAIQESSRRIACIILDSSSNDLGKDDLSNYSSKAQFLDQKTLTFLNQKDFSSLGKIFSILAEEAKRGRSQSSLVLFGLLRELEAGKWKPEVLLSKRFRNKENLIINFRV